MSLKANLAVGEAHRVIELIWRRFQEGSLPGHRSDPQNKLGLLIEGGGMRGVVTAAMLAVLRILGLNKIFDVVYGCSAGAANGAYFLADHWQGLRVYLDQISNYRFIKAPDWRRLFLLLLVKKPALDLDFLFGTVLAKIIPLDWEAFIQSGISLKVPATSAQTAQIEVFSQFADREDLLGALHASAQAPVIGGRAPFLYRGRRYWDAGLLDPYCIRTALADGCTHLLVLRGRPKGRGLSKFTSLLDREYVAPLLGKSNPTLAVEFLRAQTNPDVNGLARLKQSEGNPTSPPHLFSIQPSASSIEIFDLESDRNKLLRGAQSGAEAILDAFQPPEEKRRQVEFAFAALTNRKP